VSIRTVEKPHQRQRGVCAKPFARFEHLVRRARVHTVPAFGHTSAIAEKHAMDLLVWPITSELVIIRTYHHAHTRTRFFNDIRNQEIKRPSSSYINHHPDVQKSINTNVRSRELQHHERRHRKHVHAFARKNKTCVHWIFRARL
jgi:hypothetical protein